MKKIILSLALLSSLSYAMEKASPQYATVYKQIPSAIPSEIKKEMKWIRFNFKMNCESADRSNDSLSNAFNRKDWDAIEKDAQWIIERDSRYVAISYNNLGSAAYQKGNIQKAEEAYHQGLERALIVADIGCSLYNLVMIFEKQNKDFCTTPEYQSYLNNPKVILEAARIALTKQKPERMMHILRTVQNKTDQMIHDKSLKTYHPLIHAFLEPERSEEKFLQFDLQMIKALTVVYSTALDEKRRDRCMFASFKKIMRENPDKSHIPIVPLLELSYLADKIYGMEMEKRPRYLFAPDSARRTLLQSGENLIWKDEKPTDPHDKYGNENRRFARFLEMGGLDAFKPHYQ